MNIDAHISFVEELDKEIKPLEEKLRRLQEIRAYHAERAGLRFNAPLTTNLLDLFVTKRSRFKNVNQREAAETLLRESEGPLRAGDIARAMVDGGYPKPDKMDKLANALFTTMSRDTDRFQKVAPGLWALRLENGKEHSEEQGR